MLDCFLSSDRHVMRDIPKLCVRTFSCQARSFSNYLFFVPESLITCCLLDQLSCGRFYEVIPQKWYCG